MNTCVIAIEEPFYGREHYLTSGMSPGEEPYPVQSPNLPYAKMFVGEETAEKIAGRVRDQYEEKFEEDYDWEVNVREVEINLK